MGNSKKVFRTEFVADVHNDSPVHHENIDTWNEIDSSMYKREKTTKISNLAFPT